MLLKEILDLNKMKGLTEEWIKGDSYTFKEIKLKSNSKIGIQGPYSYTQFIKDFSEEDAKSFKGFVKGTWFVQHTKSGFENENSSKPNYKIFKDIKSANKYKKKLQMELSNK